MPMTDESRRALFQQTITSYLARGYEIVARQQWSVTLSRLKEFNWLDFIRLAGIFYLLNRRETITIAIDRDGRIHMAPGRVRIAGIDQTPAAPAAPAMPQPRPVVSDAPPRIDTPPPADAPPLVGRYEILCTRHDGGAISHVGFRDATGTLQRITKREAIEGIAAGRLEFFVARNGIPTNVFVAGSPGHEFLKTEADNTSGNNLSSLPDCGEARARFDVPAGTAPAFPYSPHLFVGATTPYHALAAENPCEVYHDRADCPEGKQIREEERIPGTGGRDKCGECAKLEEAGW